jgi:2-polyprenyl-3-methyl-5-hydroxy-6-metoxy-1,4-benzoquinol methylase
MRQKLQYLWQSVRNLPDASRHLCPNCGGEPLETVQRKLLLTALVRCGTCRLLYRTPTDPPAHNYDFYQSDYTCGFTTDCPDDARLSRLLETRFEGEEKHFGPQIAMLRALGMKPGMTILDFGSSWGYGAWQMADAGFDVRGYEISRPRARYAREKLRLRVTDELSEVAGPFDCFFSCHVMEHVPSPTDTIELARKLVRPGGWFVAYTPNGSRHRLEVDPDSYRAHWGYLHPNVLDEEFYLRHLSDRPKIMASPPYDLGAIGSWDRRGDKVMDLSGWELFVAAVM